jgi:hypothetical protein
MSGNGELQLEELHMMKPPPEPEAYMVMHPAPFLTRWPVMKYPNAWRRFWYKLLLGWRFEKNPEAG